MTLNAPASEHRLAANAAHLDALENESIHILREVIAEFERPVLLFSGGKDSIALLHLARKAFWPMNVPFPVMHIDTGHNFPEVIEYRDRIVTQLRLRLIVASVQEAINDGRVSEGVEHNASRNRLQTIPLLDAINDNRFDAVFGGARRDEEKARAKERVFSIRDQFGQWNPRRQRPELWNLYNGAHRTGEHVRIFPLSNWTELDIWQYIESQEIEIPSIYYAHEREVIERNGMLMATGEHVTPRENEIPFREVVRYRTVGDTTCTAAIRSNATTVAGVIAEVATARITERGASRADDRASESAMEDRKREGYF